MSRPIKINMRDYLQKTTLKWEKLICFLIFYSVSMYLLEVQYSGTDYSLGIWLWSERIVASVFTLEFLLRWSQYGWRRDFLKNYYTVIDFISILPFWLGFVFYLPVLTPCATECLRIVRTLRVLRLLKFARYNNSVEIILNNIISVQEQLKMVGWVSLTTVLFSSVLLHEAERAAQPNVFGTLSKSIWWAVVTVTTVGYGDSFPITVAGRVIAVITMIVGISVIGAMLGIMGSAFVKGDAA